MKKKSKESLRIGHVTIFKRDRSQYWQQSYTINGRQYKKSMRTTSKQAAILRAQQDSELIDQFRRGDYSPPPDVPTLGECIKGFMNYSMSRNTPETLKNKGYYNQIILEFFGADTLITDFTQNLTKIKEFISYLRNKRGISGTTVNRWLAHIRSVVLEVRENLENVGIIIKNPINKKMFSKEKIREGYFGEVLLINILKKAKEISSEVSLAELGNRQKRNQFYFFTYALLKAATGGRWSSLKFLKKSDFLVDFAHAFVDEQENASETQQNCDHEIIVNVECISIGEEQGERIFVWKEASSADNKYMILYSSNTHMNADIGDRGMLEYMRDRWYFRMELYYIVLRKMKTKKPIRLQIQRNVYDHIMSLPDTTYIFDVQRDKPIEMRKATIFRYYWDRLRKELRLPSIWKMYHLRHTFATLMLKKGISHRQVQLMLGHSSLTQTERYTKPETDTSFLSEIKKVIPIEKKDVPTAIKVRGKLSQSK